MGLSETLFNSISCFYGIHDARGSNQSEISVEPIGEQSCISFARQNPESCYRTEDFHIFLDLGTIKFKNEHGRADT